MVAVLDASITATWFLPDEASEPADNAYALMRRGALVLHAPELWLWECGNIVANAVKRRRLSVADALLAWSAVDSIRSRIELLPPDPAQVAAALPIALEHGLSLYDAAYLRLAMSLQIPLLTSDRAVARAASANAVLPLSLDDLA
ncbi:MAG: type II toxin-antitoxin system VapC family toxin [Caldimonas sp.]